MGGAASLRRSEGLLIAAATLLLTLASWTATSELIPYSSDTGLRFLQVQSLVSQGWQTFAIEYPGRAIDPDLRHVPYYSAYSLVDDGVYLNIGAVFPLLAAFFYALLGAAGLCVIPVAGSVCTAWATVGIARDLGLPRPNLFFLATLALTPMAFYGMVFWDHSLTTALAVAGLHRVLRGLRNHGAEKGRTWSLGSGGALIAIATTQRPEYYVFAAAVGVAVLTLSPSRWRQCGQLATGGALAAAPVWLLQYLWVGHPLGMGTAPHLFGAVVKAPAFADTLHRFVASSHPANSNVDWAAATASLGTVVLLAALRWPHLRSPSALVAGLCLAAVGYAIAAVCALEASLSGVAISFALLPLSLASLADPGVKASRSPRPDRVLAIVVVTFSVAVVAIWPFDGGLQWGVRYLLPIYPLLLVLALHGYQGWRQRLVGAQLRAWRIGAVALLSLALVTQGLGVRSVFLPKERLEIVRAKLLEMSVPLIITDHPHLPSFLVSMVPLGTSFVGAKDDRTLRTLLSRFAASGGRRIGLTPSQRDWLHVPKRAGTVRVRARELKPHSVRRIILELD